MKHANYNACSACTAVKNEYIILSNKYDILHEIFTTNASCNDIIAMLDKTEFYIREISTDDVCNKKYGASIFKYLRERFGLSNVSMYRCTSYLAFAIDCENYELVDYICDVYEIDFDKDGTICCNLLEYACECGYIELVKYMLEVDAITDIDNI